MSDSITKYGTIITRQGKERIAACILSGQLVDITQAAVGDGGGAYYQPDDTQTALKNERWRGQIASAKINPKTPNMIDVKAVVGAEVGGFTIREASLIASDGVTVAICNLPDTEKTAFSDGVSGKLTLLLHLVVEDASVLRFTVDANLDTVTREELAAALSAHDADPAAHPDLRAALSAHDADGAAHPDLRAGLSGLEDRVTALEDSGFVTLDDQGKIPVSLLPGMGFIEMIDGDIPAEQRMENTIYASRKWDVSVPAESE